MRAYQRCTAKRDKRRLGRLAVYEGLGFIAILISPVLFTDMANVATSSGKQRLDAKLIRSDLVLRSTILSFWIVFLLALMSVPGWSQFQGGGTIGLGPYFQPGQEITNAVAIRYKFRANQNLSPGPGIKIVFTTRRLYTSVCLKPQP
jgi:hypothetical protein